MHVYIEAEYFEVIEKQYENEKGNFFSKSANNLRAVFNLLTELKMETTVPNNEIVKFAKGLAGNKTYSSLKDVILTQSIKNQHLKTVDSIDEVRDRSGFYFVKTNISPGANVIVKDSSFDFQHFYENCTVNGFTFDGDIRALNQFVPPTNAMIISDPYIFDDPFEIKISKVCEFVNMFKAECNNIPFQLTILTKTENANRARNGFEELSKIKNLEVQLIILSRNAISHDREIYTNYSYMNIGLPFLNQKTNFNQNFLAVENDPGQINRNYANYKGRLEEIYKKIENTPRHIGHVQQRWENAEFTNRLFK
jgi:hypothetical protein